MRSPLLLRLIQLALGWYALAGSLGAMISAPHDPRMAAGLGVLALVAAVAFVAVRRRRPWAGRSLLVFALAVLPLSAAFLPHAPPGEQSTVLRAVLIGGVLWVSLWTLASRYVAKRVAPTA